MAGSPTDCSEGRGANGTANAGAGFNWRSLVNSTYRWILSGSGTGEYYAELSGGGDPSLSGQTGMSVTTDGTTNQDTEGTAGNLNAGEWDWNDIDTLGFLTVYVRLDDDTDPDTKKDGFVQMGATGGKDYSQQNAAQLQLTDFATGGIGSTALSTATGGLTALMVDNYIQLHAGTNLVVSWYRLTAVADSNNATIDRAADDGVGGVSGASGDLGGAIDEFTDAFLDDSDIVIGGNTLHPNSETMTLTGAISLAKSGTAIAPITIDAYQITRGDNPEEANRLEIAAGANSTNFNQFWRFKNIIGTTTSAGGFRVDVGCTFENSKITNNSVTANRPAFNTNDADVQIIECEGISTNGRAFNIVDSGAYLNSCHAHSSDIGFNITAFRVDVLNSASKGNNTGVVFSATGDSGSFTGGVITNNGTGISTAVGTRLLRILSNILNGNTTGLLAGDNLKSSVLDYNLWNNTTDISGDAVKGTHSVTASPNMTDPTNEDYTLSSGSPALDAGVTISTKVGANGVYKMNCGPDQDSNVVGGGGLLVHPGMGGGMRG